MINWQLPKQGIRGPVLRDHIAGSSQKLIEVTAHQTIDFLLDHGLKSGYYSRENVEEHAKAKFWENFNSNALLTFFPTYTLHNCILESPWYIAYAVSTILRALKKFFFHLWLIIVIRSSAF